MKNEKSIAWPVFGTKEEEKSLGNLGCWSQYASLGALLPRPGTRSRVVDDKLPSGSTSLLHVALWPFSSHPSEPGPELGLVVLLG